MTKILALTDALGNLVRFVLLPRQRFDTVGVAPLIEGVEFDALIADKAFDSDAIITELSERGAKIVISQHPRRTTPLPIDKEMYKWRRLIENFFAKLKEFKRIAMRADKTDQSFSAMIHIVAAVISSQQTLGGETQIADFIRNSAKTDVRGEAHSSISIQERQLQKKQEGRTEDELLTSRPGS